MSFILKATQQRLVGLEILRSSRARQLSYSEAEDDARLLAARLRETLEPSWLKACRLTPLPRGGLLVAGFLSYLLDLVPVQISWDRPATAEPVLLVDDCSLSGAKLAQALRGLPSREVMFATLCSPPQLRQAVREQEPRVRGFESVRDLADLSLHHFPDSRKREAWRRRWRERRPDAYWIGLPEIVAFPWSEPDHPVWNPDTGTVDEGWRLAPPDQCLKNWAQLGLPPAPSRRTYNTAPGVAYQTGLDSILLCRLEDGAVFELQGVAADMWRALAAYGDLQASETYLLPRYQVSAADLRQDLQDFTAQLTRERLIVKESAA